MEVIETNKKVGVLGHHFTRAGAERLRRDYKPMHPGLRYEVERVRLFKWAVVGYQNIALPDRYEPDEVTMRRIRREVEQQDRKR